jgi:hypothetical protein
MSISGELAMLHRRTVANHAKRVRILNETPAR